MSGNMESVLKSFRIRFKRPEILEEALRHSSYCNEVGGGLASNERLEFLGDAVLGLVVADWLVERCPDWEEGRLTRARSLVVSKKGLAKVAARLGISQHLQVGKGESEDHLRHLPSILSGAFEAVVGAVYMDRGHRAARSFLLRVLREELEQCLSKAAEPIDDKSHLQIVAQETYKELPRYETLSEEGPDHAKVFTVRVSVGTKALASGNGRSKKEAEQRAAAAALAVLAEAEQRAAKADSGESA